MIRALGNLQKKAKSSAMGDNIWRIVKPDQWIFAEGSIGSISIISSRIKRMQNPKVRLFGDARSDLLEVYQGRQSEKSCAGNTSENQTRGRTSELLSLRVGNVYQNSKPVTDLLFDKSIVKGKELSRAVPVNVDGRNAINELVNWHRKRYGDVNDKRPLFP